MGMGSHASFPFFPQGDSEGDLWSVGVSCRALCPGVMSL